MSTAASLLTALVDDAALFPPGNAPMPAAVAGHRRHRGAPYAALVGRFLCPASRLGELRAELDGERERAHATGGDQGPTGDVDPPPLRLGLIVDTGRSGLPAALAEVAADDRLRLDAIEIPLRPTEHTPAAMQAAARETVAALPAGTAYVEIPREAGWQDALDVVTAHGRAAKLRTGGLRAEAFPSVAEVAAFVVACAERDTPFKCTAGLHQAVRHRDHETGFEHHGFLNILLAAHAALTGSDPAAVLDERDAHALADVARGIDDGAARETRRLFAGYGSCSVDEPVTDLATLGLM